MGVSNEILKKRFQLLHFLGGYVLAFTLQVSLQSVMRTTVNTHNNVSKEETHTFGGITFDSSSFVVYISYLFWITSSNVFRC